MRHEECREEVEVRGGYFSNDESRAVTVLVQGDQGGRTLTDPERGYSGKLVFAERVMREERIHIHVVDATGFGELLRGRPAVCHHLKREKAGIRAEPARDPLFGSRLTPRRVSVHDSAPLRIDLSALDAGTAAHEATLNELQGFLEKVGLKLRAAASGAPPFDAGYVTDSSRTIVEVKSLSPDNESQQIRLGLGQVLEYTYLASKVASVRPVLVVERQPASAHWRHVAASAGVLLTWAPDFPGLP